MPKKVLIVTYYWPPSGGIGVLRCLKIAKYLRRSGWEPIIYCPKNAQYPRLDHSNDKDIPNGIEILRQSIWEPYAIYRLITGKRKNENVNDVLISTDKKEGLAHKMSTWIRCNLFLPDARAFWIRPSIKFLSNYLDKNNVDAIFSCGPPHTNTRIATLISKKYNIPFLADFQDPWTQVDYFKNLPLTSWGLKRHQEAELEALNQSSAITIVSKSWKQDLMQIGAKNVSVLYWGYDPEDFESLQSKVDDKFTISHLGIMSKDRNPRVLFKVIKELNKEIPGFKEDLVLHLVGQFDYSIKESFLQENIEYNIKMTSSVERKEALKLTCSSNVLLLLLNKQDNIKGRVPGKFFEYLASKRPILTLGATEGDVVEIVKATKRGACLDYKDYDGIKTVLTELYRKYKNKSLCAPLTNPIDQFSHPVLTKKVAKILDDISQQ